MNSFLQEEKSEPLPTLQAAAAATAALTSAFLLLLHLKLCNYPYRKFSSAEGHTTFISVTVLPPSQGMLGHLANMSASSCSLWPVLLSQQKPKLCFRQLPAFPLLLWETENIFLLNKLFCNCCPANLCGTFTGECFAQHGVHQHSQHHAGLSWRRQVFKLKISSCSQTWGTWDHCQYKEGHPERLTRMTSPTLLWQQWHFSREHRHFASPLFTQPFCSCMCQGLSRKKRSQHLPSKPPRAKPEEHAAKPFWHRPWCLCKEQITPAERLPAEQPDTHCSLSHSASVPVPTVPSKASCQPDQTGKDDFVLYSRGWQLRRIWTEKTGLHC